MFNLREGLNDYYLKKKKKIKKKNHMQNKLLVVVFHSDMCVVLIDPRYKD